MNSRLHNAIPATRSSGCTLFVHPDDAARSGVITPGAAVLSSAVSSVEVEEEVTDAVAAGVVSLPHGWGHTGDGVQLTNTVATPGRT